MIEPVLANESSEGHLLQPGMEVHLMVVATGKNLRVDKNSEERKQVDTGGGAGKRATWIVREGAHEFDGSIRFQNKWHEERWLRIRGNGDIDCGGDGGGWTEFIPIHHSPYRISLRAAKDPNYHVGFSEDGDPLNAAEVELGESSWIVFKPAKFIKPGMVIHLKSDRSGCLKQRKCEDDDKEVTANGGTSKKSSWVVIGNEEEDAYPPHGLIALQNMKHEECFLRITNGGAVNAGGGEGGNLTWFRVIYFADDRIALRSHKNPEFHIGVTKKGKMKDANDQKGLGPATRFKWFEKEGADDPEDDDEE